MSEPELGVQVSCHPVLCLNQKLLFVKNSAMTDGVGEPSVSFKAYDRFVTCLDMKERDAYHVQTLFSKITYM